MVVLRVIRITADLLHSEKCLALVSGVISANVDVWLNVTSRFLVLAYLLQLVFEWDLYTCL